MIAALGGGLMLINNLGSLHASRVDDASGGPAVFVSLVSAFNSGGRVLSGSASDYLLYELGVPRPYLLAAGDLRTTRTTRARLHLS